MSFGRIGIEAGPLSQWLVSALTAVELPVISSEHFSVDGTLIEAWASMKSFKPKEPPAGGDDGSGGRNAPSDFRGDEFVP